MEQRFVIEANEPRCTIVHKNLNRVIHLTEFSDKYLEYLAKIDCMFGQVFFDEIFIRSTCNKYFVVYV